MKKLGLLFLACTWIMAPALIAMEPAEIFADGLRAFRLGHWQEASELFTQFLTTWPSHLLVEKAHQYRLLSEIRGEDQVNSLAQAAKISSWTAALDALSGKLTPAEEAEVRVAISREGSQGPTAAELPSLAASDLLQHFQRGWLPEPALSPMTTLDWTTTWMALHRGDLTPELHSLLALHRAQAMWQILLSPLVADSERARLEKLSCWPLSSLIHEELQTAFRLGDLDVKKTSALLGLSFAKFIHKVDPLTTPYFSYLRARGIHLNEAYCPR